MNQNLQNFAARAAPAIFVVLWSTGFVATKYVLSGAEPLTYLAIRMAVVVGLMAVIASVRHQDTPYEQLLMAGVERHEARRDVDSQ